MIDLQPHILSEFKAATQREWLETNGIGGFASSTVIGLNTRRYHGLLTAATNPPVGRVVMLSKLEETLVIDDQRFDLSSNQYPGTVHPNGFQYQTHFRLDPFPIFTYEVADVRIEKSIFMVHGSNTTVVQYKLTTPDKLEKVLLEIRPLLAFRDYHSTTHENGSINKKFETDRGVTSFSTYKDLPTLFLSHDTCEVQPTGYWYRNFQYELERERGLDFMEDLFNPCCLVFELSSATPTRLIASTESTSVDLSEQLRINETKRREQIAKIHPNKPDFISTLTTAADQFIVKRGTGQTVIAGYHWFSDWGRDTMIALPGLTLATKRTEVAQGILQEFAKHVDQGMLPNRFPDAGETPEYNTVDATLWFFEAIRALVHSTGDYKLIQETFYHVLTDIIEWHIKGTRYNIHMAEDGLLYSGEDGVQLTWMDAKVDNWVVTPRRGKPVEIQALWYNALRLMQDLALKFDDKSKSEAYATMAQTCMESFNQQFWNAEEGCLYDVLDDGVQDSSIRPNQIFAISLHYSMLSTTRARQILEVVNRDLLTPRGLRTLSPRDPHYQGRYEGNPRSRDSVYHQGTVWPWLIGPYIKACLKTLGEDAGRTFANKWLEGFTEHLNDACMGQVSEIFDGDAPHIPRGCVAQAWSVAEILGAAIAAKYSNERNSGTAATV